MHTIRPTFTITSSPLSKQGGVSLKSLLFFTYPAKQIGSLAAIILLFFSLSVAYAQKPAAGIIKGTVQTSDGKPAEFVNITLQSTTNGTVVSRTGHYTLTNIAPGSYTLVASFTGLITQTRQVTVNEGQTQTADFTLSENNQQLQEVVVSSGKTNKFTRKSSDYAAKMPLKNLENPQVYSEVTQELIKDQQVVDFQSALQNVTGGTPMQNPDRSIFIMLRGFEAYGNVRNGMATGSGNFGGIDPVNLERIEVLKGPSGTLFGSSITSYGGVVNRVTKKPYDHFGGEISYTSGGYDLSRLTADINTPVNADKTALLRINAASHSEGSFLDAGGQNHWIVAPSFTYKPNDRLTLTLDAEASYSDATALIEGGQGLDNLSAKKWNQINLPYTSSLTGKDLRNREGHQNVFAGIDYKLSDKWTSHTVYSYGSDQLDQYNMVFTNFKNDSLMSRAIYAGRNAQFRTMDIQQNFNGEFKTGSIKHRVLLGIDYYKNNIDYPSSYISYDDNVNFTQPGTDNIAADRVSDSLSKHPVTGSLTRQNILAAYASDVINFTDRLIGSASVRVDHFSSPDADGYSQTAVSPKFGLIYQLVKDQVSLFGNYMNGFQNTGGFDFNHSAFRPQHAYQWEGGVKSDLIAGKLSATLSYYNILVSNMTRADLAHPGFEVQDATQRSKGFEAELIANPAAGLNIAAGYGYNNNAYEKIDADLVGKRPVESPANTVNFWASYKVQEGSLSGFVLGFGGNYVSEMFSYFDADNHAALPAYTLLRATLTYDQPRYSIGIKGDNLTNQHYWNSNGQAQNLRTLTGTVTYKF